MHGDGCPQINILIVKDRVCTADFDWAGKLGTVRYSPGLYKPTFHTCWHSTVNCTSWTDSERAQSLPDRENKEAAQRVKKHANV